MSEKDSEMPGTVRSKPILERHVQSILLALIVGGILWVGNNMVTYGQQIAVINSSMAQLQSTLTQMQTDLRASNGKFAVKTEVDAALAQDRSDIRSLRERITTLEARTSTSGN